jgi:hypothetical protein
LTITIDIPDDLAPQFTRPGQDLTHTVLEDAAVEAYRMRRLTGMQLSRLLVLATRYELDGLLKARRFWLEYTLEDLKPDRETHRKLGL